MTNASPVRLRYEGEGEFKPASPYWARRGDLIFTIGAVYELSEVQERSLISHAHYFSAVNEAWKNLPDEMFDKFPSAEKLRKFALIQCGYHDSHSLVCRSHAEALKVAKFMGPIDEFSAVVVNAATVTRMTAKSQNYRSMDRKTFQESKDKVLGYLANMIGTSPAELSKAGENNA